MTQSPELTELRKLAMEATSDEALLVLLHHMEAFGAIGFDQKFPHPPGSSPSLAHYSSVEIATARLAMKALLNAVAPDFAALLNALEEAERAMTMAGTFMSEPGMGDGPRKLALNACVKAVATIAVLRAKSALATIDALGANKAETK